MKVLAIARPRPGVNLSEAIAARAQEELRALWELYRTGTVREMYSPGGLGAILILEAENGEQASSLLAGLPLVGAEILDFEVIELQPFRAVEMLFAQ